MENKAMSKLIESKTELIETIKYVARETTRLCENIIGKSFPIKSLTIFTHDEMEYKLLFAILGTLGNPYNYNNGPRVELFEPIIVDDNKITHLRLRKPDSERPQVGCNDFATDYESFKKEYLLKYPENLNLIIRPEYEMIELHDKSFGVLAYVVSN